MIRYLKFESAAILMAINSITCGRDPLPGRFSARLRIMEGDNIVLAGAIYVQCGRYRMDITQDNERFSLIVIRESEWTWLVMHDNRTCAYFASDDPETISSDPFAGLRFLESGFDSNRLGNDLISGYECVKYMIEDGGRRLMTYWRSDTLHFPLKIIEHGAIDTVTELSEIREGEIEDSLFRISDDYTILGQRWTP